jgi:hypothetical protein
MNGSFECLPPELWSYIGQLLCEKLVHVLPLRLASKRWFRVIMALRSFRVLFAQYGVYKRADTLSIPLPLVESSIDRTFAVIELMNHTINHLEYVVPKWYDVEEEVVVKEARLLTELSDSIGRIRKECFTSPKLRCFAGVFKKLEHRLLEKLVS